MTTITKFAEPGSISHGTLMPSDIASTFVSHLRMLASLNNHAGHLAKCDEIDAIIANATTSDADELSEVLNDLDDLLGEYAPPKHYFGSNFGDGSDFGFWLEDREEFIYGDSRLGDSNLLRLPFDHIVLAYVKNGQDREFVVVKRNDKHTPYVAYRLERSAATEKQSCMHGNYCSTHQEAMARLVERAFGGTMENAAFHE